MFAINNDAFKKLPQPQNYICFEGNSSNWCLPKFCYGVEKLKFSWFGYDLPKRAEENVIRFDLGKEIPCLRNAHETRKDSLATRTSV